MPYYIRVLGTQNPDIQIDELIDTLKSENLSAKFAIAEGEQPNKWTIIEVANEHGNTLTQIERNPVIEGELGQEELEEFRENIQDYKPSSAVNWLDNFFDKVKVIYAFQLLDAAFNDNNFEIISAIKNYIWNKTSGILQADNEGFSNDDGYHILWQFSDNVNGEWSCAIINSAGQWERFKMDLGDKVQRQEFWDGKVPKNSKLL
jgi:hypothetical protein